nr:endonuclease [Gemmatimonadaceae bacterium]
PFDELAPFIPKAIAKITEFGNDPVLVVNSDKDVQAQQQSLNFDQNDTWRILVGGAKLSRGFTVEGLTTTYFRRSTNMSDSLTQMGRWFGFRRGYLDLVRLYIARSAKFGSRTVDLYEAFESVAIDEAGFRGELKRYSVRDGDQPAITPIEIPPLVTQHLPWLLPTAANKMFNAVLERQSEQPFRPYGYPNRLDHLQHNLGCWRKTLASANELVQMDSHKNKFGALVGVVSAAELVEAISKMKFLAREYDATISPRLAFYADMLAKGAVEDFLLFAPQVDSDLRADIAGVGERSVVKRSRRAGRNGLFGAIDDWKHRPALEEFVSAEPPAELSAWAGPKRGAVLLYLAREPQPEYEKSDTKVADGPEKGLVVAFNAYLPAHLLPPTGVRQFRVRDPQSPDSATIAAD